MKPFLLFYALLLIAGLYFLMIRPARARQRQALVVQQSLQPGVEVMTTAGLFATVSSVEDDVVVLEVAPGVLNRYVKAAVARVVTPPADVLGGDAPVEPGADTGKNTDDDATDG